MARHKAPQTAPAAGSSLIDVPAAPAGLDAVGRQKWTETAATLIPAGLLTSSDLDALEVYCRAWSDVRQCDEAIDEHGAFYQSERTGTWCQHPAVNRRVKAFDSIRRFQTAFGMNPAARNAVTVAPKTVDESENEFFN